MSLCTNSHYSSRDFVLIGIVVESRVPSSSRLRSVPLSSNFTGNFENTQIYLPPIFMSKLLVSVKYRASESYTNLRMPSFCEQKPRFVYEDSIVQSFQVLPYPVRKSWATKASKATSGAIKRGYKPPIGLRTPITLPCYLRLYSMIFFG